MKYKNAKLAALLQAVPLIGTASCITTAATCRPLSGYGAGILILLPWLLWGLGYLYLGRWIRLILLWIIVILGVLCTVPLLEPLADICAEGGGFSSRRSYVELIIHYGILGATLVVLIAYDAYTLADDIR